MSSAFASLGAKASPGLIASTKFPSERALIAAIEVLLQEQEGRSNVCDNHAFRTPESTTSCCCERTGPTTRQLISPHQLRMGWEIFCS